MKDILAAKATENKIKAGTLYGEKHPQEVLTTLSKPLTVINTRAEIAKAAGACYLLLDRRHTLPTLARQPLRRK